MSKWDKLSETSAKLNTLREKALSDINEVDARIDHIGVGVSARIELSVGGMDWGVGYGRLRRKARGSVWTLLIWDPISHEAYPLDEAPDDVLIVAAAYLDKIVQQLIYRSRSLLENTQAATASVKELLNNDT